MKRIKGIKHHTYSLFDDWRLEVEETKDEFSAYLYRESIGRKNFLIGTPKVQPDEVVTLDRFCGLVTFQIYKDMEWYDEETEAIEEFYMNKE